MSSDSRPGERRPAVWRWVLVFVILVALFIALAWFLLYSPIPRLGPVPTLVPRPAMSLIMHPPAVGATGLPGYNHPA